MLGVPICLLGIVGLVVNPFPEDAWYSTWTFLFWPTQLYGAAYTPVAAPAYVYGTAHLIALAFGVGLEHEFRLAAAMLGVLQFVSCGFILLSCRALGRPRIGVAVSLGTLLFAQSTYMTQSFWSEGVINPLVAATMYALVRLYVSPPPTLRSTILASVLAGAGVGLLTISRFVPGLMVAPLLFVAWQRLERSRALVYSISSVGIVVAIILGQMAANQYRFGKFVLSDSAGLHLWDVVSAIADEVLTQSEDYQILKNITPIRGKLIFEACHDVYAKTFREPCHERLGRAAIHGVLFHPLAFVAQAYEYFTGQLTAAPDTFGLWMQPGGGGPLSRTSHLPPLFASAHVWGEALQVVHAAVQKSYKIIVLGSIWITLCGVIGAVVQRPRAQQVSFQARSYGQPGVSTAYAPLAGVLLAAFLACTFATACLARPQGRYSAIFLPLLAVLFCYALGLVWELVETAGRAIAVEPRSTHRD